MTENILFDMGNVLIHFDPEAFTARQGLSPEDSGLLNRQVFLGPEWKELDRGAIEAEDAISRMCGRLPQRLHASVRTLVLDWDRHSGQIEGMEDIVAELADSGYGLYLLTNAAATHHVYWPKFPVSRYFEGRILRSCDWHLLKPDRAFYEKAFELFRLDREKCLFIDDMPENVEGARQAGLEALLFTGAAALRDELRKRGI